MMDGVLASLVIFVTAFLSTPGPSNWLDDYGKALQHTRSTRQPLLIVLDIPQERSRSIEQVRFSANETSRQLLEPYILCHIDVTTSYGKKVADAFEATEFPHTAIIDKTGKKIIYSKTGRFTIRDWVDTLVSYRAGEVHVRQVNPRYSSTSTNSNFIGGRVCFT